MSPWEVSHTKKMPLNLPPHSVPSTIWGTCQGCSALKDLSIGPETPGTANTSLHCLRGSYFPMAFNEAALRPHNCLLRVPGFLFPAPLQRSPHQ